MFTGFGLSERSKSVVGDRDGAGLRDIEIAAIWTNGRKDARQVPGGAIVRRRNVSDVGFWERVVRGVAKVFEDALVWVSEV